MRQVEYKDKMEEEWERFQKQMKEEAHVCYQNIFTNFFNFCSTSVQYSPNTYIRVISLAFVYSHVWKSIIDM